MQKREVKKKGINHKRDSKIKLSLVLKWRRPFHAGRSLEYSVKVNEKLLNAWLR